MLKKLLIGLGALVGLAVLSLAALLLFVDANRFKPQIEQYVRDNYRRALTIDGDLGLTAFPRIALSLPKTTLSSLDGERAAASIGSARVGVALFALLRGELQIDRVRIEALQATVERRRDGSTSIDDLLRRDAARADVPATTGAPPKFEIGGIELVDADLTLNDLASNSTYRVHALNLTTGRVASAGKTPVELSARFSATQPEASGDLKLKATLDLDLARAAFGIEALTGALNATIDGDSYVLDAEAGELRFGDGVRGARIGVGARLRGAYSGEARLALGKLDGTRQSAAIDELRLTTNLVQGSRKIVADMASPAQLSVEGQWLQLERLAGEVTLDDPSAPARRVKLTLAGSVAVDAAKQTVAVQLDTRFDDTQLAAKIDVAGFDKPRIGFDLDADRLNVDRYLPQATADSAPRRAEAATNDVQFDFGFLRELNLAGQARVGQLQAFNIKSSTVRVGLKAASGRLDVAPLTAQLYGGTVNATASAQAAGNRVGLNADLAGVAIQPLLNDAAGTDLLEGRGNVKLAVNTAGTSVEAMKRALGGSGSLRLTDGAIRGINLAQKIRDARNLLAAGRSETQTSDASQKTDFSEISASFAIKDGVASSSDLDGRSPLLRLAGAGSADIGASRLDYTLRVSVVETTRGQSGPEIDALRGLTIPVHLSGPFDQPSWKIDWGTVAQQALKSRAGEELKKQLAPQTERLKEERDKLRDQLRGGLKGLLQR